MRDLNALAESIGVYFENLGLLELSLTHSSAVHESSCQNLGSNERLEYLGDALIELSVSEYLYNKFPDCQEGELTKFRSTIVRRETLAQVAEKLGIGEHIVMGIGMESMGGRKKDSILADTLEAIVGALFLDQGYETACAFSQRILSSDLNIVDSASVDINPKGNLMELVHQMGLALPIYEIVDVTGKHPNQIFRAEVRINGEIYGTGNGSRKLHAEEAAAREALSSLIS